MCGIAGFFDPGLNRDTAEALLGKMLGTIRHRGPDSSAAWVDMPLSLGHNRLSIIDLSDEANQPMHDDNLVIVYNGEIYNYVELRKELIERGHRFHTSSDTEVILAAYRAWGQDCVKYFVGMWAFAIWDKEAHELFCSRDRFGIKPFYFIHSGDQFYFASEYRTLKQSPLFKGDLNDQQVARGLHLGMVAYGEETYFECVRVLPERCNLMFERGSVRISRYWDIDSANRFVGTFADKTARFEELFRNSVNLHMRSDVEVGACLSGGLDSTSIVASIQRDFEDTPLKTFTLYYEGAEQMDERPWVTEFTREYPRLKAFHCSPSDNAVAECFDAILDAHEVPMGGSPAISYYFVSQLAAQHNVKVLLDGQGADEILAGYTPSFIRLIGGSLRNLSPLSALKTLLWCRKTQALGGLETGNLLLRSLLAALFDENHLYSLAYLRQGPFLLSDKTTPFELEQRQTSRLNQYLYQLLFVTLLPALLHYGDRMSMAFSIESRVPFLDHRLIEFLFSLDDQDKLYQGQTKYIQRRALTDILPPAISQRLDKQPFYGREMAHWLRGPLRHLVDTPVDFHRLRMLHEKNVQELLRNFKAGDNRNVWKVWSLTILNYWASKQ